MEKRSRILVVDDEARNLRLMEALLLPMGYEVIMANDEEEALEKVREMPLAGRIVAIADVFDALISKRPYRESFSLKKSFDIIRESKGSHFDPDVVDAFFAVEDEILSIKAKYKDEQGSLFVQMVGKAPDLREN